MSDLLLTQGHAPKRSFHAASSRRHSDQPAIKGRVGYDGGIVDRPPYSFGDLIRAMKEKTPARDTGIKSSARRTARRASSKGNAATRKLAVEAARLCHDRHCEDVLVFDVRGLSEVSDYILIATGTSDRQIKAVGGEIADLAQGVGVGRFGTERDTGGKWLVLDFVDLVVHLFDPMLRGHYDLEMMWNDAPKVTWRRRGKRV